MYYHIVSILSSIIIYCNMYSEFTSGSNLIKAVAALAAASPGLHSSGLGDFDPVGLRGISERGQ